MDRSELNKAIDEFCIMGDTFMLAVLTKKH